MKKLLNLKVVAIEAETADAVTIHLRPPLFRKLGYAAGQYLNLEFDSAGSPEPVRRAYSLSSTPGIDRHLSITVKRVAGGMVSNQLLHKLSTGDTVKALGAQGRFTLTPNPQQARHLVLLAGGSGITPIFSILKCALYFEPDTRVSLIYCNRDRESVIFRDKLAWLKERFGERLNIVHVFSRAADGPNSGRLTRARAVELIGGLAEPGAEYYLCGPAGMMEEVLDALRELKVPEQAIHLENFVPKKAAAPAVPGTASTKQVSLQMQGQQHRFQVQPGQSILEAALANGIQLPHSCRSGFCTACVCKKLSGEVSMSEGHGLSEAELKRGQALMCVGYPMTDEVCLEVE
jgi:ring-1,2-phenylacetyl-CoA epoxidase subunit PaaE